jgi:hypothetical protein
VKWRRASRDLRSPFELTSDTRDCSTIWSHCIIVSISSQDVAMWRGSRGSLRPPYLSDYPTHQPSKSKSRPQSHSVRHSNKPETKTGTIPLQSLQRFPVFVWLVSRSATQLTNITILGSEQTAKVSTVAYLRGE